MKTFTSKTLLYVTVFLLFGWLNIHAADDGLITKQITITLNEAGTLPGKIGSTKKFKISNLKIVGKINGTDVAYLREMAGADFYGKPTDGKLEFLDLSDAQIVKGGDSYFYYNGTYYNTNNDIISGSFLDGCKNLTNITLPSNISSIGDYAFCNCSNLTDITLPPSVTSIGIYAFCNCKKITEFTIPFGISKIDNYTFAGCSGLANITIPSSISSINFLAFSGCCNLTAISIPTSVTEIGPYAFQNCSNLTSISIPTSITEIGDGAFEGCISLSKTNLPPHIKYIGFRLFSNCNSLINVNIPSTVTSIGEQAFYGCNSLTSIDIPANVTSIGEKAFWDCSSLTSVYVNWQNPISISNNIFSTVDNKCILYVPNGTYDNYWLSYWGDYFNNIVEYDATGIDNTTTSGDAKEMSRYSVNGQRLDKPAKGMNIVKYSDGSVKKVVVK